MKKIFQILGTVLLIGFVLSTVNCFKEKNFEARVEKIASKISKHLDLNDKQKIELERIKKEIIEKKKSLHSNNSHTSAHKEVIAMVKSDKMDLAKLKATMSTAQSQRKEMREFMLEKLVEFHAILTPEQRIKLADKMETFSKRMGKHYKDED